jgi:PilZ domain
VKSSIIRELRAVQRYSVSLPVYVTWRAQGASSPSLNALTRDISTRGMFVVADAEPAAGDLLEFEIDMALDRETPLVVVRGAGRVVRAERSSERAAGFAVHNLWFQLREPEEGEALPLDFQALAHLTGQSPPGAGASFPRHRLTIVPPQVKAGSDSDVDSDQENRNE